MLSSFLSNPWGGLVDLSGSSPQRQSRTGAGPLGAGGSPSPAGKGGATAGPTSLAARLQPFVVDGYVLYNPGGPFQEYLLRVEDALLLHLLKANARPDSLAEYTAAFLAAAAAVEDKAHRSRNPDSAGASGASPLAQLRSVGHAAYTAQSPVASLRLAVRALASHRPADIFELIDAALARVAQQQRSQGVEPARPLGRQALRNHARSLVALERHALCYMPLQDDPLGGVLHLNRLQLPEGASATELLAGGAVRAAWGLDLQHSGSPQIHGIFVTHPLHSSERPYLCSAQGYAIVRERRVISVPPLPGVRVRDEGEPVEALFVWYIYNPSLSTVYYCCSTVEGSPLPPLFGWQQSGLGKVPAPLFRIVDAPPPVDLSGGVAAPVRGGLGPGEWFFDKGSFVRVPARRRGAAQEKTGRAGVGEGGRASSTGSISCRQTSPNPNLTGSVSSRQTSSGSDEDSDDSNDVEESGRGRRVRRVRGDEDEVGDEGGERDEEEDDDPNPNPNRWEKDEEENDEEDDENDDENSRVSMAASEGGESVEMAEMALLERVAVARRGRLGLGLGLERVALARHGRAGGGALTRCIEVISPQPPAGLEGRSKDRDRHRGGVPKSRPAVVLPLPRASAAAEAWAQGGGAEESVAARVLEEDVRVQALLSSCGEGERGLRERQQWLEAKRVWLSAAEAETLLRGFEGEEGEGAPEVSEAEEESQQRALFLQHWALDSVVEQSRRAAAARMEQERLEWEQREEQERARALGTAPGGLSPATSLKSLASAPPSPGQPLSGTAPGTPARSAHDSPMPSPRPHDRDRRGLRELLEMTQPCGSGGGGGGGGTGAGAGNEGNKEGGGGRVSVLGMEMWPPSRKVRSSGSASASSPDPSSPEKLCYVIRITLSDIANLQARNEERDRERERERERDLTLTLTLTERERERDRSRARPRGAPLPSPLGGRLEGAAQGDAEANPNPNPNSNPQGDAEAESESDDSDIGMGLEGEPIEAAVAEEEQHPQSNPNPSHPQSNPNPSHPQSGMPRPRYNTVGSSLLEAGPDDVPPLAEGSEGESSYAAFARDLVRRLASRIGTDSRRVFTVRRDLPTLCTFHAELALLLATTDGAMQPPPFPDPFVIGTAEEGVLQALLQVSAEVAR